jgi:DNA-binding transcriptional MerR regulator
LLKINEFAHVAHISSRMLRHYDAMGLLQPAFVDDGTGYRYYTLDQLPRLNRILALKDLGFGLEHIRDLVDQELSVEQLRAMLLLKQAETRQLVEAEQARLARIEARIKQLEEGNAPLAIEVVMTSVPSLLVACVSGDIDDEWDAGIVIGDLFAELLLAIRQTNKHPSQQRLLLWQSSEDSIIYSQLPIEVAIPISAPIATHDRITTRELPAVPLMATTLHQGAYHAMSQTVQSLYRWIAANGYRVCGECREFYLQRGKDMDNPVYLTEIQLPVERL